MTEMSNVDDICIECLKKINGGHQISYQESLICLSCAEAFYAICAECARLVAADEAFLIDVGGDSPVYCCPECKSSITNQTELNFDADEVAALVDEYVVLHAEEKQIKERMEAIKEQLKAFAETASDGGKRAVAIPGTDGGAGVKCTYRTSFKADAGKVSQLRNCLGDELFAALFSEKFSFDVNKANFEKIVSEDAEIPEDVRRQIADAVKISVSATLNVA